VALEKSNPVATLEAGDLFRRNDLHEYLPALRHRRRRGRRGRAGDAPQRPVHPPAQQKIAGWLEERYRERHINNHLRTVPLFARLSGTTGIEESSIICGRA